MKDTICSDSILPQLDQHTHTLLLMAQEIRDAVAFDCTQGKNHDPRCCLQTSRVAGSPRCGGTSAGLHGAKTPTSIQPGRFQAFLSPQDRLKRVCRGKIPPQVPDPRIQPHTDLSTPVMCLVGQDHHMRRAEDVRKAALDASVLRLRTPSDLCCCFLCSTEPKTLYNPLSHSKTGQEQENKGHQIIKFLKLQA